MTASNWIAIAGISITALIMGGTMLITWGRVIAELNQLKGICVTVQSIDARTAANEREIAVLQQAHRDRVDAGQCVPRRA